MSGPSMMLAMDRRRFLREAGVVTVLVAGGGVWRAWDRGVFSGRSGPAFEAWRTWRSDVAEGPLALVRAAILAASAANSQPWLFRLRATSIELFVDERRNLGLFDPYLRELHISLGCALENLTLAAAPNGYRSTLTLVRAPLATLSDHPEPKLVARVDLEPARKQADDLYAAIPNRHTNRALFDAGRPIPGEFIEELARRAGGETAARLILFTDDAQRTAVARLIADAGRVIGSHPEIEKAIAPLLRTDWHEMEKQRDGLSFGDFGESPGETAMEKFFPAPILRAITPRQTPAPYEEVMLRGRLFGLIAVRDRYDSADNVVAGRIWQRAHLLATARGLAARPANQSVELIDHERRWGSEPRQSAALGAITGDPSWQPTFMFFMGYPTRDAAPTVRRSVHDVIV